MPKRTDIHTIMIIGAGPIIIGQACEFDYSGTQACKALREEGYRIVLVNSNPATIMTDPDLADATYIEPITPEIVAKIIEKERGDRSKGFALLPTMGGQTALNCALSLKQMGVLEKFGVEMIGATAEAIDKAEDRAAVPRGDEEDRPRHAALAPRQRLRRQEGRQGRRSAKKRAEIEAAIADPSERQRALEALPARLGRQRARAQAPLRVEGPAGSARSARRRRPARHHPPLLHARRHGRRHRLRPGGIHRHRPERPRRLADHRSADRGKRARLEGVRDGGRPRQGGQLHHRLLDREHRSDGRAHGRFDHRRPCPDADRQGIPDHARRLDRGAARDRRRDRRLERAVRGQSRQTAA